MIGFRFFFLLIGILMLPAVAQAAGECTPLKPFKTAMNVNLTVGEPFYDTSMSWAKLATDHQQQTADWLKKNNLQGMWSVNDLKTAGEASGGWGVVYRFNVLYKPFDHYGVYSCPFFKSIDIDLFYRTLIQIPKDFVAQPCVFQTVQDHELMHNAANTKAVNIYTEKLRGDLVPIIAQLEADYVPVRNIPQREASMKQAVTDMVKVYFEEAMPAKMNQLNALIDTPQEYAVRSVMMDACKKNE